MPDDVPADIQKILDGMDNFTCGCTNMGPQGKGMCKCRRNVKNPGEVCNSCVKHWHQYDS